MTDTTKHPLLVVDDEAPNRDMLTRRLRRAGYAVEMAASGQEALDYLREHEVELVLLDVMMPGMIGIELLKLLRATYSPAALPVIMVSALGDSDKVVNALNAGANDYVTKPVDFPVAVARIESQLTRKGIEAALRESEERYALAARGANDGLWDWDLRSNLIYYSPRWMEMLGYEDGEISDSPEEWLSRVHADDRPQLTEELNGLRNANEKQEFESEHRLRHKDGTYRWMLARGGVLHGEQGEATRMAGSLTDITGSKTFDSLTGLPNRELFAEKLARAIEIVREDHSRSFAVLFVDLDRFKVVNDSLGHSVGDQLLLGVARRLENAVRAGCGKRPSDIVARFGGDEFAILVNELSDLREATPVAERIQSELRSPFLLDGRNVVASASIGIAMGNADYSTPAEVLRDADTAMYRAKSMGRGRCEVFDAEMRADALARLELEIDLHSALENDEFVVHYQPKTDMETGQVVGFEALLRWAHPKHGIVAPDRFIPIAEDTGLIVPIGRWVLREAVGQLRLWEDRYQRVPPLEMAVNVSVKQIQEENFVREVSEIIQEFGIQPSCLELEITESVLVEKTNVAFGALSSLKELGVGLKIDDFGTGYSSLNYLSRLPFDGVKIDKSFVMEMNSNPCDSEVVSSILALAKGLNLGVVAEGVETEQHVVMLRSLGCQIGQGYFFSRPVSAERAEEFLRSKEPP